MLFTHDTIEIKKYPFRGFCKTILINYAQITFVKIDIDILSVCINANEIIFIPVNYKIQLDQFVSRYSIEMIERADVWELICYPFVDEHRTEEDLLANQKMLNELFFDENEVREIRRKIKMLMIIWVIFTMEYTSIIHLDVLCARRNIYFFKPFFKRFYWFTMKIALKGFGVQ
ncbi:MAG: hypothetical protein ABL940_05495 [Bacteroidia bacterium]